MSNVKMQRASAAIVAVVWAVSALIPGSAGGLTVQEGGAISIVVKEEDEGRALAAVVRELEQRFGWIITYEDPAYLFAPEIQDVRHLRRNGKDLPLLVPRGGPFSFLYTLPPASPTTSPQEAVLSALLHQYHQTGYAGRFRLERTGLVYHIVPEMAKDEAGVLRPYRSILDTKISLPDREVDGVEMFESIAAAINTRRGEPRVEMPTSHLGGLERSRVRTAADNESARLVLLRTLPSLNPTLRFSWQLLCSTGHRPCSLNVHVVPPVSR